MPNWWLAVGPPDHWKIAFKHGNIWAVSGDLKANWEKLQEGDHILFYSTQPVSGVIGYGVLRSKFRQDKPFWPSEVQEGKVKWPYAFKIDVKYLLLPDEWGKCKVSTDYIRRAARRGLQRIKEEEAQKTIEKLITCSTKTKA